MATKQDLPATDSAAVLHDLVGDDATAGFENDPKFADSNPAVDASSEHLQVRKDRGDFQNLPDVEARGTVDDNEDPEDEDDEDDDEYEDVETEDEDDDDEDDEDEEDDDLEDDDDDDDDEDDEEEDEE